MPAMKCLLTIILMLTPALASAQPKTSRLLPKLTEAGVPSSLDNETQPVLYWAPEKAKTELTPLFVFLHSWSGDYRQDNSKWHAQAVQRGWIYLHPNFRGVNQTPKACGSKWARRDILDAIDFAIDNFKVDPDRIYLAGTSGGGHMAMLMAGHHPDRFSAVSAWVGISDLAAWYRFHLRDGKPQRYAKMILASLGGAPGSNAEIDAEYKDRSSIHHLHQIGNLPLQICAGINDGHTGSVPVTHSLNAFNIVAQSQGTKPIPDSVVTSLSNRTFKAEKSPTKAVNKIDFGRDIVFQRSTGNTSVVLFDGGHEGLPDPACNWLHTHRRVAVSNP